MLQAFAAPAALAVLLLLHTPARCDAFGSVGLIKKPDCTQYKDDQAGLSRAFPDQGGWTCAQVKLEGGCTNERTKAYAQIYCKKTCMEPAKCAPTQAPTEHPVPSPPTQRPTVYRSYYTAPPTKHPSPRPTRKCVDTPGSVDGDRECEDYELQDWCVNGKATSKYLHENAMRGKWGLPNKVKQSCCACGKAPPPPTRRPTKGPTKPLKDTRKQTCTRPRFGHGHPYCYGGCTVSPSYYCKHDKKFKNECQLTCYKLFGDMPTPRPTPPTKHPTKRPTRPPTKRPTWTPTKTPTPQPTRTPTTYPTMNPTRTPTKYPTKYPTGTPTTAPTTATPTKPACHDNNAYIKKQFGAQGITSCTKAKSIGHVCTSSNKQFKAAATQYCPITCMLGCGCPCLNAGECVAAAPSSNRRRAQGSKYAMVTSFAGSCKCNGGFTGTRCELCEDDDNALAVYMKTLGIGSVQTCRAAKIGAQICTSVNADLKEKATLYCPRTCEAGCAATN